MKKIVINPNNVDISLAKEAAGVIASGGIVAMPTETVYGLAALANNQSAVDRLYRIKQRSKDKPFSFALGDVDTAINQYFDYLPPYGYRLIEKFWPGPLTIIYRASGDEKIGIRIPSHAVANKILQEVNKSVYFSSANISGGKEIGSASLVESVFGDKVDLIVDGGDCAYFQPSTVVDLTCRPFNILRKGIVLEEDIAVTFIQKRILFICTGNSCRSPMAQFLLMKYLNETKPYFMERYEVISRGISAVTGLGVTEQVASVLEEKEGLGIKGFCAQRLNRHDILSSDLIFTMEEAQSRHILEIEPTAEGRVFALKKFLPPELEKDIPDPIGKDIAFYEEVYSLIKDAVLELIDWL